MPPKDEPHPRLPAREADAFARAAVSQLPGSMLRVVHFRGGQIVYDDPGLLVLSMGLTSQFRLDYNVASTRADVLPMVGRFGLMTPGQRFLVELTGECTVMQLALPRATLAGWLEEDHEVDSSRVEIGWGHSLDDPAIGQMLCAARTADGPDEVIILRRIAARLFERFATNRAPPSTARGGLPLHKLRRVIEYIEDNPRRMVTVDELARLASLSPFHFAHQFQRETGRSPYRFVIERRLSRAIALLRNAELPIETIAARCGFSHTSHLSRHLHRVTGHSPTQLRQTVLL